MLGQLTRQLIRPAVDHWQGLHSWPLTLVVSVIGMTYLFGQALLQLPMSPVFLSIACWIVAGSALLTWQVVGTIKAINTNLAPPSEPFSAWGGYFTILVAVILVGLKTFDGVARHFPEPVPEALLSSATFEVRVDKPTATISIDGELNYGSNAALADTLERHPATKRIVLNSTGGQIFAARVIAGHIQRLGLDTHVEANCFSACTIAFMAGAKRTIVPKGQLGFHRYAFANPFTVQTVDPAAEQEKDRRFFLKRGVSPEFLDRMFDTDSSNIWRPTHAELLAAAVITAAP